MYKNGVAVCYKINYVRLNGEKGSMRDLEDLVFFAFCYCYKMFNGQQSFSLVSLKCIMFCIKFLLLLSLCYYFYFIFILLMLNAMGCPIIWQFNYCH
uniref:Uncharacterized protein n=1 Tax=Solanum lycopersicum TaxID=4081 RepID=A0A3Q7IXG2_SOLLC